MASSIVSTAEAEMAKARPARTLLGILTLACCPWRSTAAVLSMCVMVRPHGEHAVLSVSWHCAALNHALQACAAPPACRAVHWSCAPAWCAYQHAHWHVPP